MSAARTPQQFFSSYAFYEGLRLTLGIMVPVAAGIYWNREAYGILAAIGAMACGITDVSGPLHHRINGMMAAILGSAIATGTTLVLLPFPIALAIWLLGMSFLLSFIILYGNRAGQLGSAILLVIMLMTDAQRQIQYPLLAAGTVAAGAAVYMAISLLLHRAKPYKMAQQMLAECILQTASFFDIKAAFYFEPANQDTLLLKLATAQHQLNEAQEKAREVLFKTRRIVKESTHTGRVLLLSFLDTVDLFETTMAAQPDYDLFHQQLNHSGLMRQIGTLIEQFAKELRMIATAFQTGQALPSDQQSTAQLADIEEAFSAFKNNRQSRTDIAFFIQVRKLLDALYSIDKRIQQLRFYTTYDQSIQLKKQVDVAQFVIPSRITLPAALLHLSWKSNILRYSIRVMAAVGCGYLISLLLPIGHAYWLLLTIMVILKPAYSITTRRNRDRLLGTALGVGIGYGIIALISTPAMLLAIMVASMLTAFSFMRHRYFTSVTLLTVFVLLAFRLLRAGNVQDLIADRLVDTAIGSAIAFLFMWIIPPLWEKQRMHEEAIKCLQACRKYLEVAIANVQGAVISTQQYKVPRKQAFVMFANFSDAFQRMTNEPDRMQQHAPYWYQLVVGSNALLSQIAGLASARREDYAARVIQGLDAYKTTLDETLEDAIEELAGSRQPDDEAAEQQRMLLHEQVQREADKIFEERLAELAADQGPTANREKLKTIKHLENTLGNLFQISNDLIKAAIKLTPAKP